MSLAPRFAYNHGYYSPDIDITWSGFVGPGIANVGVDGPAPSESPAALDPNATGTVPQRASTRFARGKLRIPAGAAWNFATGIDPEVMQEGTR